jgi:hypothetical protein
MRIPFSLYDFFGYLASGFLAVVAVDKVFEMGLVVGRELRGADIGLLAAVAYIVGHLLCELAQITVGHKNIGRCFGPPWKVLLGRVPRRWWHWVFGAYYSPLPQSVADEIVQKADAANVDIDQDEFFYHAFTLVKSADVTMGRLDTFLILYGFSRNVFFVGCLLACLFIGHGIAAHNLDELLLGVVIVVVSLGMFRRYLRFYRQYALELLLTYWRL